MGKVLKFVILLIFCIAIFESSCKECAKVKWAFESSQIVTDVIETAPLMELKVKFESNISLNLGNELTPSQVIEQPYEIDWISEPDAFYTLIFTDPDAPSTEDFSLREFIHWLVVNIPGNDVRNGEHLVEYVGSGPTKGSGLHRYTYLVFKQLEAGINPDSPKASNDSISERVLFNTKAFAKKHQLGQPVAGNFYRAQWDEYVPMLHNFWGLDEN